jgi:chemosensory pili system protein ChpA (sensor histidine kinase/response regulator)
MAYSENQIALEWLRGEIANTLDQAKRALETFASDRSQSAQLEFCLGYVHQVDGIFNMVELTGAAALSSTMEKLVSAMANGKITVNDEALAVLMEGILQLPRYLDLLKKGQQDDPAILGHNINQMRALLNLDAKLYSAPIDLTSFYDNDFNLDTINENDLQALVAKMRPGVQAALAQMIKGDSQKSYVFFQKVITALMQRYNKTELSVLWMLQNALIQRLIAGELDSNTEVIKLLRLLDSSLKKLNDFGKVALNSTVDEKLLQRLAHYIIEPKTKISELKPLSKQLGLHQQSASFSAPDAQTLKSVSDLLLEEIEQAKDQLDIIARTSNFDEEKLAQLFTACQGYANTLLVIGLNGANKNLQDAITQNQQLCDDTTLMSLASALIGVEQALAHYAKGTANIEQPAIVDVEQALMKEVALGLDKVKAKITEFMQSGNNSIVATASKELDELTNALNMTVAGQRAAVIIENIQAFIKQELVNSDSLPDNDVLDHFANVLIGLEYYLERFEKDGQGSDYLLNNAEEELKAIGFEVVKTVQETEPELVVQPVVEAVEIVDEIEEQDDLIDDEILEIFVEEAEEVLEEINKYYPVFKADTANTDALAEIRRAYHTLKGSGRMVSATVIGDVAWSIENMLNRLVEGNIQTSPDFFLLIETVTEKVPALVEEFSQNKQQQTQELTQISDAAFAIAKGEQADLSFIAGIDITNSEPEENTDTIEDSIDMQEALPTLEIETDTDIEDVPTLDLDPDLDDSENEESLELDLSELETAPESEDFALPLSLDLDEDVTLEATPNHVDKVKDADFLSSSSLELNAEDLMMDFDTEDDSTESAFDITANEDSEEVEFDLSDVSFETSEESSDQELTLDLDDVNFETSDVPNDEELTLELDSNDFDLALGSDAVLETETAEDSIELDLDLPDTLENVAVNEEALAVTEEIAELTKDQKLEANGFDAELIDIFQQEMAGHLQVIANYIEHSRLLGSVELSNDLQRAFHTIKGSAYTSEVKAIGNVAKSLEGLVVDILEFNLTPKMNVIDVMEQGFDTIVAANEELNTDGIVSLDPQTTIDAIEALRHELIAPSTESADANSSGIESVMLSDSLNNYFDHDPSDWLLDNLSSTLLSELSADLRTVADAVFALEFKQLHSLCDATANMYEKLQQHLNDDGIKMAQQAYSAMTDVFDFLAAGQSPEIDFEFVAQMIAFTEQLGQQKSVVAGSVALTGDEEVIEIFVEEAEELLESINNYMEVWHSGDESALAGLQRDLHTFKGSARMAGAAPVGDLSHELEFLYEGLAERRYESTPAMISTLDQCHTRLAQMMDEIQSSNACVPADELVQQILDYRSGATEAETTDATPSGSPQVNVQTIDGVDQSDVSEVTQTVSNIDGVTLDIPELDKMDIDIVNIFVEEAEELMAELDPVINNLATDPGNEEYRHEIERLFHTLKGGARLAKWTEFGDFTHDLESWLETCRGQAFDAQGIARLQAANDTLTQAVETLQGILQRFGQEAPIGPSVIAQVEEFERKLPTAKAVESNKPDYMQQETDILHKLQDMVVGNKQSESKEAIKIPAQRLEQLVNLAGETSISNARVEQQIIQFQYMLGEMDATISRLSEQVRILDTETQAQVASRKQKVEDNDDEHFDPLEMDRYSSMQQIARSMYESATDLMDFKETLESKVREAESTLGLQTRINTELQEGLMAARMVPFSRLLPRLRRIVRQTSGELNKDVELVTLNTDGDMDRNILERMTSPLEHMIRNSLDHGLEATSDRLAAGKQAKGRIEIALQRQGGDIIIKISDDGAGINVDRVKEKAIERGLMEENSNLSTSEILRFIFDAGFSTADSVTQISGRGVGMDVVHAEVKQLGGSLSIDSEAGQGTSFSIRLPFTVSVNRALMVQTGEDMYALPLNTVEAVVRLPAVQVKSLLSSKTATYEYQDVEYNLERLSDILGLGHTQDIEDYGLLPIILVKTHGGSKSIALYVDQMIGSREVVVKSLGPQFKEMDMVSGATILGDGRVVIILDMGALTRHDDFINGSEEATQQLVYDTGIAKRERELTRPLQVMVVDDSVTVRKVSTRLLQRKGYDVLTAKDGVDAMTVLQDHIPDVILLDIEMPRMDGFEVASRVRHSDALKHIPIIMITSRTGDKHRQRAMDLGVNDYLGKPFHEDDLIPSIEKLTGHSNTAEKA